MITPLLSPVCHHVIDIPNITRSGHVHNADGEYGQVMLLIQISSGNDHISNMIEGESAFKMGMFKVFVISKCFSHRGCCRQLGLIIVNQDEDMAQKLC